MANPDWTIRAVSRSRWQGRRRTGGNPAPGGNQHPIDRPRRSNVVPKAAAEGTGRAGPVARNRCARGDRVSGPPARSILSRGCNDLRSATRNNQRARSIAVVHQQALTAGARDSGGRHRTNTARHDSGSSWSRKDLSRIGNLRSAEASLHRGRRRQGCALCRYRYDKNGQHNQPP
jgi:hypothetical protein